MTGSGRLEGKVALITGGGSGIGRASALRFAREGAQIAVSDINAEAGESLVAEATNSGYDILFTRTDVTDASSVARAFEAVDDRFGGLDVLYNCAGGSTSADSSVEQLTAETVDDVMKLEVGSVFACSKEALPRLAARGGGVVVNMSSFVAFRGVWNIHAYIAAKGALVSLTRAMAGAYANKRIRVNAIAPGIALSERAAARISDGNIAGVMTFGWDDYPLAIGRPEDIASVALFLCSDESVMVTGQTIVADGGLSAY